MASFSLTALLVLAVWFIPLIILIIGSITLHVIMSYFFVKYKILHY